MSACISLSLSLTFPDAPHGAVNFTTYPRVQPQQAQIQVQGSSHAPCEEELTEGRYYMKRGVGKKQ